MKQSKNTKRALVTSVLTMLLCMVMLIGSTFAWFTDTVTTGKNKIVAGNLDVALQYSIDGESWTDVDEETNVFTKDALWEPGYTEVVYLRVKNEGNLALKYQFGINVEKETPGYTAKDVPINLSEFIEFGVAETSKVYESRTEARNAVEASAVPISAGYSSEAGQLLKKDDVSNMLALVVYMPEDTDNKANHGPDDGDEPSIDMGIKLVATQYTEEEDSFDNQYDKNAWNALIATKVESFNDLSAALEKNDIIMLTENIDKTYESNDSGTKTMEFTGEKTVDLGGKTLNITSGSGKNGIVGSEGAKATIANGTITMNKVYGSSYPVIHANHGEITLDNMNVTLESDSDYCVSAGSDGGKIVIKNSTITGPNGKYKAAVYTGSQSTVEFEDCVIIGAIRAENNGNLTIKSGDFTQASFVYGGNSGKRIVYAGTFANDPKNLGLKLAEGSTATSNDDGTWTVTASAPAQE